VFKHKNPILEKGNARVKRLAKQEIRLQYSGLIIFAAKLLSVATGMIFTLLITRNTTREEYGVWSNVFDLLAYFMLLSGALPFWTTRFVARGKEGAAKTGLLANLILALISVAIYLPLVPLLTGALATSGYILLYFVAAAQMINLYAIGVLESCLRSVKPHAVGYGLLIEEAVKVSLAYLLIVRFQLELLGAMISLIIAVSIQIVYYVKLTWADLGQKIQWNYVREWLKGSIANIYYVIGNQIAAFIFIWLFSLGSPEARGNYQAAATIANIVAYSSFLAFALYPKLLAKDSLEDVTASLKMVLMFAVPMAAGAMAISESFLIILDAPYGEAAPILFLLALDALVLTISQFYTFVFLGVEKLDEEAKIPLAQLVRSHIFKVFTLPYIHALITLPTTFYVLTAFAAGQPVQAAIYVTVINMTARIAMFAVLYMIMRKSVRIIVPWRSVGKYVFASVVMGSVLYLLPHPTRIFLTLATAAAGGLVYMALLLAIDEEARALAVSILQEVRSRFRYRA
jgi:O-antigen/teichoic acid export membrane protein